jgi:acyl-CoA dehydrogenase
MGIADLDFDLNDTERAVRETAHRFAQDVMRPTGIALDKLTAEEVIADGSELWDVHKKYAELGLGVIDSELSPIEQARLQTIIWEEMGWGDSGLAISLAAGDFPSFTAAMTGNPDLMAAFPPDQIGCWGITEPDHGSDTLDFDSKAAAVDGSAGKSNCIARADGNEYVISGQKSAWVSNGTIAESSALYCAVETNDGKTGFGVFLVPLEGPNVSRGKPLEKMGQRALNQGEIFFDDVRIPADYMFAGPDTYSLITDMTLVRANAAMGIIFAGTAKSAFDLALDYAKERVQGGVPIIQHQSVKARIFQMYRKVEAARALAARAYCFNVAGGDPRLEVSIAAKITCTQTAFEVASEAIQIFGGNGISREYPVEKIMRDARLSMIEDGCNDILGLIGADRLAT